MIKPILAAVVLAAGLMLAASAAIADAYLYVRDGFYLNARIGPGTRYRVHHVLAPGTRVEIVTRVGNWAHVRTPEGLILWVYFTYLSTQAPYAIVRPPPPIFILPPPPRPRIVPPAPPPRWYTPRYRVRPRPWVHPQPRVKPKPPPQPRVQRPAKPKVQRPRKPKVQRPTQPRRQPIPPQQRSYDPNEVLGITRKGRIIYKGR